MKSLIHMLVVFSLLLVGVGNVLGQTVRDFEKRLYEAYVDGKVYAWKGIIDEMDKQYQKTKQKQMLYAVSFARYGYIGYSIDGNREEDAKSCLKQVMRDVKTLRELYADRHDVLALQGALLGYKMILSKFSSLYLGPKLFKLINEASASSDRYFNCSLEVGNMRFYTPKFLGGSKKEAIAYYENAVKIIDRSQLKEDRNWIYINTLLILAKAYYDTGAEEKACKVYTQILEYEPDISWIEKEMVQRCGKKQLSRN